MTYRFARHRGLFFGALFAIVPGLDVLAGGARAGVMHLVAVTLGAALIAALARGERS
jgi:hypothetical protein